MAGTILCQCAFNLIVVNRRERHRWFLMGDVLGCVEHGGGGLLSTFAKGQLAFGHRVPSLSESRQCLRVYLPTLSEGWRYLLAHLPSFT